MPVRHGKDGKLEYYKNNPIQYMKDFGNMLWRDGGKKKKKTKKEPYEGYSYASSSCSPTTEHSCSPEECTTCKNDDCPNRYDDFIEQGEMEL
jgi:hypothetical protein